MTLAERKEYVALRIFDNAWEHIEALYGNNGLDEKDALARLTESITIANALELIKEDEVGKIVADAQAKAKRYCERKGLTIS